MTRIMMLLFVLCGIALSQAYEDVVYLKDGSIIHGMIIEFAPGRYIKIQSDRNVFVYQLDDIDKITREIYKQARADISDKSWAIHMGIGNTRGINLLGISKDFRIGEKGALFLTAGFGLNLIGVGYSRQSHYNGNGMVLSGTLGSNGGGLSLNGTLAHQWRIANQGFISVGLMAGAFENEEGDNSLVFPMVAFDYRF